MFKQSTCIIFNNPITNNLKAVLNETHEAHLQCWCKLLPNTNNTTREEREKNIKNLINKYL